MNLPRIEEITLADFQFGDILLIEDVMIRVERITKTHHVTFEGPQIGIEPRRKFVAYRRPNTREEEMNLSLVRIIPHIATYDVVYFDEKNNMVEYLDEENILCCIPCSKKFHTKEAESQVKILTGFEGKKLKELLKVSYIID
jgi:hypothetical protein